MSDWRIRIDAPNGMDAEVFLDAASLAGRSPRERVRAIVEAVEDYAILLVGRTDD